MAQLDYSHMINCNSYFSCLFENNLSDYDYYTQIVRD